MALCSTPVARWLANEVSHLLKSGSLASALFAECSGYSTSHLTPAQDQLVGVICHLPDLLANRLGRSLPALLVPPAYFKQVGMSLYNCLERVYAAIKGSSYY